jgi:hypothetical protein
VKVELPSRDELVKQAISEEVSGGEGSIGFPNFECYSFLSVRRGNESNFLKKVKFLCSQLVILSPSIKPIMQVFSPNFVSDDGQIFPFFIEVENVHIFAIKLFSHLVKSNEFTEGFEVIFQGKLD